MFSAEIIQTIKEHCRAEAPKEACGFVAWDKYHPLANLHENPENNFRIEQDVYRQFLAMPGGIQAVVHSHTDGTGYPSKLDMEQQQAMAVPWGIVMVGKNGVVHDPEWWGEGVPIPELIGRTFLWGIRDCFSLCRDYYRTEKGIIYPDYPREYKHWDKGISMYLDHYREAGFIQISKNELKPGDGVIGAIHAKIPNHAGIYLGNGLLLHHIETRLSRREPIEPWMKYVTHALRHKDML
jgi:proteasome lid subunit RPN8/RPN11